MRYLLLFLALSALAQLPEPNGEGIRPGTFPAAWITGGPNCVEIPDFQVHEYNPDFYILRESGCLNYEKPFIYLLFGKEKALMVDTGAGATEIARTVNHVMSEWLKRNQRESIPLIVAHSHGHGDHTSGDAQLRERANTTVIGTSVEDVQKFFGFQKWPEDRVEFDLGGRIVDVLAIPGHQDASIALYDRETAVLLTGDTVYPGRLYVRDGPTFAASIRRLIEFTADKPVSHVLGCHIEQSAKPFVDYPIRTTYQPQEHALQLSRGVLLEIDEAMRVMSAALRRYSMRDITIYPNRR